MRDMVRSLESFMRPLEQVEPSRESWLPPVDIKETSEAIEILADMPGFKAEELEVNADGSMLTLRGESTRQERHEGETYHRLERSHGTFERSFRIPQSVDASKIEAHFDNGVLRLTLPKREETRPRAIEVKIK